MELGLCRGSLCDLGGLDVLVHLRKTGVMPCLSVGSGTQRLANCKPEY